VAAPGGAEGVGSARRDKLARAEWAAALVLTAGVAALAVVRLLHAGGLWRDEAGAARLATLPSLREAFALFQHEAFPPLFLLTVRAYVRLAGGGDLALRLFGLAVGLGIAGVLWLNARSTARTAPLLSLALLGLDAPFLIYGGSVRGYGIGSALILLTYGLLARGLAEPPGRPLDARRLALAVLTALAAIASVQLLLSNAALLFVLCAAAAAVALARRRWWRAAWIAGCGAAAALSLLPYAAQLAAARREWSIVVTYPVGAGWIWRRFMETVGPRPVLFVWLLLLVVGPAVVLRELERRRAAAAVPDAARPSEPSEPSETPEPSETSGPPETPEPGRLDAIAFAALTIVGAPLAYWLFLGRLGYPPRPWYFLPLMAILATALDTVWGGLTRFGGGLGVASQRRRAMRRLRIGAAAVVAAAQVLPLSQRLVARQTNADLVAKTVAAAAAPQDLVVVVPWYYAVSFDRYYHGAARRLTLPVIEDHGIHRYDLLKAKLAAPHPLDDLLQAIASTLRSGRRVWLVGAARWPPPGEAPTPRPPAPRSPAGWHDYPYMVDWSAQLGRFLQSHARRIASVATGASGPVSDLEDMPLVVLQGWR
jgi:hypothetical protein